MFLHHTKKEIGTVIGVDYDAPAARFAGQVCGCTTYGTDITKKVTHHTIAQMVGSSRETVSRTMRELTERGLVEVTRRNIRIKDRKALEAAAGLA